MSNDVNQCNFVGRLGQDPEVRYSPSGDACANFSIAVGEQWKDAKGEKKESVTWVNCVAWRKLGEVVGEYLKKGAQVYVSGKMKTREWTNKEGNKQYTTEIIVDRLQMLKKPSGNSQDDNVDQRPQQRQAPKQEAKPQQKQQTQFDEDDLIPF